MSYAITGSILINRGLIQAILTSLPPQPIGEATKAHFGEESDKITNSTPESYEEMRTVAGEDVTVTCDGVRNVYETESDFAERRQIQNDLS
ncbi:hypothetical protein Tco_0599954 [Tanacetum coccineum]